MTIINSDQLIAGEPVKDLVRALAQLRGKKKPDGTFHITGRLDPEPGATLARALMRLEAQLLVEDADAVRPFEGTTRTEPQRRADAMVLLAQQILDCTQEGT